MKSINDDEENPSTNSLTMNIRMKSLTDRSSE